MFASRKSKAYAAILNTRIYSCNLICNDFPGRWRGRYNEDTILSLDMLARGCATVQFNQFLQMKTTTQVLGGGNTAEFYAKEATMLKTKGGGQVSDGGTYAKSKMLVDVYPQISKLVWKFGRAHHEVDYSVFAKNRLRFLPGREPAPGPNEFGMKLEVDQPEEVSK
jgi:hypothetical protein